MIFLSKFHSGFAISTLASLISADKQVGNAVGLHPVGGNFSCFRDCSPAQSVAFKEYVAYRLM